MDFSQKIVITGCNPGVSYRNQSLTRVDWGFELYFVLLPTLPHNFGYFFLLRMTAKDDLFPCKFYCVNFQNQLEFHIPDFFHLKGGGSLHHEQLGNVGTFEPLPPSCGPLKVLVPCALCPPSQSGMRQTSNDQISIQFPFAGHSSQTRVQISHAVESPTKPAFSDYIKPDKINRNWDLATLPTNPNPWLEYSRSDQGPFNDIIYN